MEANTTSENTTLSINDDAVDNPTDTQTVATAPSPALKKKVAAIRGLVAREERSVALMRYAIGVHVNEVIGDEASYGTNAVGRDKDSLYDYAAVAQAWREEEFDALLSRKNDDGLPLTFSHLVELAKKNKKNVFRLTPERRVELIEKALTESLSVRDLAERIRRTNAKATGKTDAEIEAGKLIPMSNRAVGMVRRLEEQLPALRDDAKMSSAQLGRLVDNCAAIERAAAKLRVRAATMLARLHPGPASMEAPRDAA